MASCLAVYYIDATVTISSPHPNLRREVIHLRSAACVMQFPRGCGRGIEIYERRVDALIAAGYVALDKSHYHATYFVGICPVVASLRGIKICNQCQNRTITVHLVRTVFF